MNDINNLFFELIRVAIGNQVCLTRTPKVKEWQELYAMAKKQSLVGICFAGVQKLQLQRQSPNSWGNEQGEMLYLLWMGMAAKIQQRNEVVNRQCVDLLSKLSAYGFNGCVLKGQGVAAIYDESLRSLRQSGDIDVWIEGGIGATLRLAEKLGQKADVTEQHVHLDIFKDPSTGSGLVTEVEAHFIPSMLRNPFANKRLQKWFSEQSPFQFRNKNKDGICVPTSEFNLVYLLIHIYRHLFGEGVGLRQVMDYYYVLSDFRTKIGRTDKKYDQEVLSVLKDLGLLEFAGALMFLMHTVFGMDKELLLCEPNVVHGRFLLDEIMRSGNMGHYDDRLKDAKKSSRWQRFWLMTKHNFRLIGYYPAETLWAPFVRVKVWAWRKKNGWI